MKIGVLSDTHDYLPGIMKAHDVFVKQEVEMICHLGDWNAPYTIQFFDQIFADFRVPVYAVPGNNEGEWRGIDRKVLKIKNVIKYPEYGLTHILDIGSLKVALFHGHDDELLQAMIDSQRYDVILTGHTHEVRNEIVTKTLILNPGSVTPAAGPKILPHGTIAILTLPEKNVEIVPLKLITTAMTN